MNINSWITTVVMLVKNPFEVWDIAFKKTAIYSKTYLWVWMVFIAIAALFRFSEDGLLSAILNATLFVGTNVGVVFFGSWVLTIFAHNQHSKVTREQMSALLILAGTGVFAGQLLANLFYMNWMNILTVYSIYLLWLGFHYLDIVPLSQRLGFFTVCGLLIGSTQLLMYWVLSSIFHILI
jgi:hypothetical protein